MIIHSLLWLSEKFLDSRIRNVGLWRYYTQYFNPINIDGVALSLTLAYLYFLGLFFYYSIAVILGVWRSTENFDRSELLKKIIRFLMLVFVFANVFVIFK